jgi:hypothetical protein
MNDAILIMIENTMMKHFKEWAYRICLRKNGYAVIMQDKRNVGHAIQLMSRFNLGKIIRVY